MIQGLWIFTLHVCCGFSKDENPVREASDSPLDNLPKTYPKNM